MAHLSLEGTVEKSSPQFVVLKAELTGKQVPACGEGFWQQV